MAKKKTKFGDLNVSEVRDDALVELLDKGYHVVLFRNGLGTITACALATPEETVDSCPEDRTTDDFNLLQTLHRITEKVLRKKIVNWTGKAKQLAKQVA